MRTFHFFLGYDLTDIATESSDDDDNSNDINALSPGVVVSSRPLALTNHIDGHLLAHGRMTFDRAQDSQSARFGTSFNNIVLDIPRVRSELCKKPIPFTILATPMSVNCRLDASLDISAVLDEGQNREFQSLEDDLFWRAGGSGELTFGFGSAASFPWRGGATSSQSEAVVGAER